MEDIEKVLHPSKDNLKVKKNGTITTTIVDAEMDAYKCKFHADGCIQINTKNYSHISLSIGKLKKLIKLIQKAEKMYAEMD